MSKCKDCQIILNIRTTDADKCSGHGVPLTCCNCGKENLEWIQSLYDQFGCNQCKQRNSQAQLGRGSVVSDLKRPWFFSQKKKGITVENNTGHTLCMRIASNSNDTTMVAVQGGLKACATDAGVKGGIQEPFNPPDSIVSYCNLRPKKSTFVATTSEKSYVTVLDGPDGFVVGDENRQVDRGMTMNIHYV
eukprot:CAMPEP_0179428984 /NCGR_PEP_ID=MMETSP0799-20121207/14499_1 /TAXON_ID=46947 /ORGANISM="Geminigera cryophila, Strain CCMP2564" /LENGTH=189 /DNA_ID=CAMNT_0021204711 /DNA_START=73 /DNA_END=642 /DNA_ORIENTATION=+